MGKKVYTARFEFILSFFRLLFHALNPQMENVRMRKIQWVWIGKVKPVSRGKCLFLIVQLKKLV